MASGLRKETLEDLPINEASTERPLEIRVSNFGPVDEAAIELRPLTVFVGSGNTGKSSLAKLIYALHRFFNSYSEISRYGPAYPVSTPNDPYRDSDIHPSDDDIERLSAWTKKTLDDTRISVGSGGAVCELPHSLAALIRPTLNRAANLTSSLEGEIARCFGMDRTENLTTYPTVDEAAYSLIAVTSAESTPEDPIVELRFAGDEKEIRTRIGRDTPLRFERDSLARRVEAERLAQQQSDREERESIARDIPGVIAGAVISYIVDPLSRPAHYLPAERAALVHAFPSVVRGLIASASRTVLRQDSPMPVISGVLGDFLEQLIALASSSTRGNPEGDNEIARRMEQALLRGTVHVERSEIDYPSFVYRPDGWKKDLKLMNASSMVSELAPVVLYLRHAVQQGDLLIIEEPESHLHPAMQVEFVRQLAAAVKSGIRILITTHSEWVLEELANLVRMSDLDEENREGVESADLQLSPEEIGAWLFERGSERSGSVVREIPLDIKSGTFPAGFGLITEDLYNRWAEISSRIQESSASENGRSCQRRN